MNALRRILERLDLHPWLFTLAPVVSLLGQNMDALPPNAGIRAAAVLMLITLIVLLVGGRIFRSPAKASVFWTLVVVTSFLAGHLAGGLASVRSSPALPGIYRGALLAWGLLVITLAVLVGKARPLAPAFRLGLNVSGLVAFGLPLVQLLANEAQMATRWSGIQPEVPPLPNAGPAGPLPDIYYIILDGYGRQDVLLDLYGLDNQAFYDALLARGFLVSEASTTNYAQTSLSLAAALNLSYLDQLPFETSQDRSQWNVAGMIRHNAVTEILSRHGYSTAAFAIGYRRAEMSSADTYRQVPHPLPVPFEALLLEQSGVAGLMYLPQLFGVPPWLPGYADQRESIQYVFEETVRLPDRPEPTFALVHILAPHPPFVFDEEGGAVPQRYPYRLGDGTEFLGTEEEYLRGYADQVKFVNAEVLRLVERLQAQSDIPPIIILQGDHGPGAHLDWDDPAKTNMWERMAILNAVSAPMLEPDTFQPNHTPVNTFRFIFNGLFGYSFETLPDRSFFSSWKDPYQFYEVKLNPDKTWSTQPPP